MKNSTIKTILGAAVISGLAVLATGEALFGEDRYGDPDSSLAQACAGLMADDRLERALFNARAQSNGGFDPVCGEFEASVALAGQPGQHGTTSQQR
jgi:hypothetical protein